VKWFKILEYILKIIHSAITVIKLAIEIIEKIFGQL